MAKARFWVDKGSRLVWVIDPGPRIAVVLGPGSTRRLEDGDGVLGGEDVLPGFRLALADLFADLPPS